ncbi:MAG: hypothetical protein E6G10_08575 [Actinobacteria bacterium]|nr:MAG: hypothetical protein E6G10_08575 [Actinomycetota bacterium]
MVGCLQGSRHGVLRHRQPFPPEPLLLSPEPPLLPPEAPSPEPLWPWPSLLPLPCPLLPTRWSIAAWT